MNIKSTVYEDTIGIEFSPDDFHAMNLSPRAVSSTETERTTMRQESSATS